MQCPCCGSTYQSTGKYIPRILINCGHTLCEQCIRALLDTARKTCPDCGEPYKDFDSINSFPKNLALLTMQRKKQPASPPPAENPAESAPANQAKLHAPTCEKEND